MRSPTDTTRALRHLCLYLALSLCSACVFWRKPPPTARPALVNQELDEKLTRLLRYDVPLISVDSLTRMREPVLLDSRERLEFEISHLPGAVRVEPGEKPPSWLDTLARDRPIVVYCSVGYRSEKFARSLRASGFTEVSNLYGSLFEWVDRGHLVVDSTGAPTQQVHTYNETWAQWLTSPRVERVN